MYKQKLPRRDLNILILSMRFHGPRVYRRQKLRDIIKRAFKQTSCSFLKTNGFHEAVFARRFILLSSLQRTRSFSRDAHLYCYVIYLSQPPPPPRREGMRALRSISGTGGAVPYFSLSLISRREKRSGRVYRATHNFALSRLTNVPAYPKLWHPAKVYVSREGKRRRSENERATRGRVSILSDGRD